MTTPDYYALGKADRHAWDTSDQYKQFDHSAPAMAVMKLFMPPVPQDAVQMQRPLPKPYQEWLRGFND